MGHGRGKSCSCTPPPVAPAIVAELGVYSYADLHLHGNIGPTGTTYNGYPVYGYVQGNILYFDGFLWVFGPSLGVKTYYHFAGPNALHGSFSYGMPGQPKVIVLPLIETGPIVLPNSNSYCQPGIPNIVHLEFDIPMNMTSWPSYAMLWWMDDEYAKQFDGYEWLSQYVINLYASGSGFHMMLPVPCFYGYKGGNLKKSGDASALQSWRALTLNFM